MSPAAPGREVPRIADLPAPPRVTGSSLFRFMDGGLGWGRSPPPKTLKGKTCHEYLAGVLDARVIAGGRDVRRWAGDRARKLAAQRRQRETEKPTGGS